MFSPSVEKEETILLDLLVVRVSGIRWGGGDGGQGYAKERGIRRTNRKSGRKEKFSKLEKSGVLEILQHSSFS